MDIVKADLIQCKRIAVVDDNDKLRIVLRVVDDSPEITMLDKYGHCILEVQETVNGSTIIRAGEVAVMDRSRQVKILMQAALDPFRLAAEESPGLVVVCNSGGELENLTPEEVVSRLNQD
ncbi:MAG TPA: hypothetical protein VM123_00605 [archaeon]|nr:hypothetical protein [archaeon]